MCQWYFITFTKDSISAHFYNSINFIRNLKLIIMNTNNQNQNSTKKSGSDNRSDMRKHQYKDHDEVLTNDENYDVDTHKFKGKEPDLDDKLNNEEKK